MIVGPNLSAKDVIKSLELLLAEIRCDGRTVVKGASDDYYHFAFEKAKAR